jgi:carbonic anhydrase/acetyltransferase-like protein (isoleucine patch superfamily)
MDTLYPYRDQHPRIAPSAFIAPTAVVIGDVDIGEEASIWFHVTIRGDVHFIRIGSGTNIQDNSCIHVTRKTHPTVIGQGVTVGHSVTLHGCTLQDGCFIGMKACILDGAVVETGAYVAAGALVPPGKIVKTGELWAGTPARCMRLMTKEEIDFIPVSAKNYIQLSREYRGAC